MHANYQTTRHTNGYEFSSGSGYELPTYAGVVPPAVASGEADYSPIVIIGAGLAGLTLAALLAQYGVRAVVLDEDNTVGVKGASSRGICYAQKSLEIFAKLGIYERIAAKGVQWSVGRTFAGHEEVYNFNLRDRAAQSLSLQPPFINIQQFYVEGFLVERVYELTQGQGQGQGQGQTPAQPTVELRWQNCLTAFAQSADVAQLTVQTPEGSYRLRADYVVDCTGSRSPLRAWLGVAVDAKKGDDRWCIADVRFKVQPPAERHTWIEAPFNDGRAVWQHLMADDVWRLDYQMRPDADAEYVSRPDVVKERLKRQFDPQNTGAFDPERDCEIVWVGPYGYRNETLQQLRVGRTFFAGDSAHVVSPFGARGGNSGIADADNLAWKLARVVGRADRHTLGHVLGHAQGRENGKAGEIPSVAQDALLTSYHTERHQAAVENASVTNRTAHFLRPLDGAERLFRMAVIALAKQQPFARALVNTGRMSVANAYTPSKNTLLTTVQNVAFQWADGSAGQLVDLQRWAGSRSLALVFGKLEALSVQFLQVLHSQGKLCVVYVSEPSVHPQRGSKAGFYTPQVREFVVDTSRQLRRALGLAEKLPHLADKNATPKTHWAQIAIIRPDGYCGQRLDISPAPLKTAQQLADQILRQAALV